MPCIFVLTMVKLAKPMRLAAITKWLILMLFITFVTLFQGLMPRTGDYKDLIKYVTDRPGHDRRYAIDISKIQNELGWTPSYDFDDGLKQTVEWYLNNEEWWQKYIKDEL